VDEEDFGDGSGFALQGLDLVDIVAILEKTDDSLDSLAALQSIIVICKRETEAMLDCRA